MKMIQSHTSTMMKKEKLNLVKFLSFVANKKASRKLLKMFLNMKNVINMLSLLLEFHTYWLCTITMKTRESSFMINSRNFSGFMIVELFTI